MGKTPRFCLGCALRCEETQYELIAFISQVMTSRTRPGFSEIRLPGERMLRCVAASKADGVDVPDATLAKLDEVAAGNNVEPVKRLA